jgi:hypothetical protein
VLRILDTENEVCQMTGSCLARNEASISLIGFIRDFEKKLAGDSFDGQEAEETSGTR